MTLRLMRGGAAATAAIYAAAAGTGRRRPNPSRDGRPAPRFAMPSDKPEYRVYRSRPGFLNRLFGRRDAARFERHDRGTASASSSKRGPEQGRGTADRGAGAPPRRRPP